MALNDQGTILMVIDRTLRVVSTDSSWDLRADSFGHDELTGDFLIGSCVLDHLKGEATKRFYREVYERAFSTQESCKIDYRCDAPDRKRFMRLSIEPRDEVLHCFHETLRVIPFTEQDRSMALLYHYVTVCSVCLSQMDKNGIWHDHKKRVADQPMKAPSDNEVLWTVCPRCRESYRSRVHLSTRSSS